MPYVEEDLVDVLWSVLDGYLMRHLLDSNRFPLETLVQAMWDCMLSMTEPGVLNSKSVPGGDQGVDFLCWLLDKARDGDIPMDVEQEAKDFGVDPLIVLSWFDSADTLCEACLDYALATRGDLRVMSTAMPLTSLEVAMELLSSVHTVATNFGPLAEKYPDAPVWTEIEDMLKESFVSRLGEEKAAIASRGAARAIRAARDAVQPNSAWQNIVETLLADDD